MFSEHAGRRYRVFHMALQSILVGTHPYPSRTFLGKSCFEVILTDGDSSSLANLEINLKLNNITPHNQELDSVESTIVKCVHLSWESVTENVVQDFSPDIMCRSDIRSIMSATSRVSACNSVVSKGTSRLWHELNRKSHETGMSGDNGVDCGVRPLSLAKHPEAYLSPVIRNAETSDRFLSLDPGQYLGRVL